MNKDNTKAFEQWARSQRDSTTDYAKRTRDRLTAASDTGKLVTRLAEIVHSLAWQVGAEEVAALTLRLAVLMVETEGPNDELITRLRGALTDLLLRDTDDQSSGRSHNGVERSRHDGMRSQISEVFTWLKVYAQIEAEEVAAAAKG